MVLSVPVPSSRVNCNSFFDFGTATHSLTFTARKSDLLNVSKSTISSNKGSTFTLEKSIFSTLGINWKWRLTEGQFTKELQKEMLALVTRFGRRNWTPDPVEEEDEEKEEA